ncbi:hypothetical protein [Kitasatospora sp. NPDC059599]|uniref:hypothetical protein n=1 Tax=Kitasatospora sp. NPDC059599 TaxID=3346880 RepID=UPI0036A8CBF9
MTVQGDAGSGADADAVAVSTRTAAGRWGWGSLGLFLLAFAVFEAVKHAGPTVPLAVAGLLVPFAAGLVPQAGSALARHLLLRPWVPLLVTAVCTAVPGPPEDTAAPFALGLAWLAHLALRAALRDDRRGVPHGVLRRVPRGVPRGDRTAAGPAGR